MGASLWQLAIGIIVYIFLMGLCVGSFLNVVIFRMPRMGLSIVRPRSYCPNCLTALAWYDNIPIFSYWMLAQKCRYCRDYIPLRYPMVELLTGVLFGLITYLILKREETWPIGLTDVNWSLLIVYLAFTATLVAVSFIDIDLRIIPNELSVGGMLLAPLFSLWVVELHRDFPMHDLVAWLPLSLVYQKALFGSCIGIVVGAALILSISIFGALLFRKEAMGMGDVKLMGFIGGILGWDGVMVTLILACIMGSVIGIARKIMTRDSYLPFGPFLAVGAVLTMMFKNEIWYWFTKTYPQWVGRIFFN